ncbi:MAG TPA: thermonuclease family protein [Vicinamibacterales bacterium]|nr:thermonuclease family protein [Vicinamibacterales bacterium]
MQILPTLSLAAVAAIALLQTPPRSEPVLVRAVLDGDTIDVAAVGRLRLLGITAPRVARGLDMSASPGRDARDRLAALVLRRYVRLEYEDLRREGVSRRAAYVLLEDGTLVNATLVREGLARVTTRAPLRRLDELRRAEAEAKTLRRGLWGRVEAPR